MLKKFLIILGILVVFTTICGYVISVNRTKIIHAAVHYTMQSILHSGNSAENSEEEENQTWVSSLFSSGSENIKYAVAEIMRERGLDTNPQSENNIQKQHLATVADMFLNATQKNKNHEISAVAKNVLSSLGHHVSDHHAIYVGHDINARDDQGRTLLMNVCRVDVTPQVVNMLIQYGADIHAVDDEGRTALMYAGALNKNMEVVSLLIEKGINVSAIDHQGKTAYDYTDDENIKELLQKYTGQ